MGDLMVLAMGGNSLIDPSLPPTVENQFSVTTRAIRPVADLIERGQRMVITHGNGPQVGFMALRSELSRQHLHEVPLDSLVANSQGSIGYMIQRALREELRRRGLETPVLAVITEVEVDPHDHAFEEPTKPIGLFYKEAEVPDLERERGWTMVEDAHRGWRRVVPSPAPVNIVQLEEIRALLDAGVVPVCCGGGGVPVVRDDDGHVRGVEGVIDKDRASALLAVRLGAARLVLTTGVDAVYLDFLTDSPRRLDTLERSRIPALLEAGQFPPGSMGPKIKAAERFLRYGGGEAIICHPDALPEALAGSSGTRITNDIPSERPDGL